MKKRKTGAIMKIQKRSESNVLSKTTKPKKVEVTKMLEPKNYMK